MADSDNSLTGNSGPVPQPRKRSRRRRRCLVPVACVTGFILLMNAGISLLLYQWQSPQTVSFDMAGTVNRFMSQLASQKLSDEQVKGMTARFNASLNASLLDYQTHHHALILVGPAVVSGAEDITGLVQSDVAGRMAQGGQDE